MLSELRHFKDPAYYTFCCEVSPTGTSETVISRQLNVATVSGDVVSESVKSDRHTNVVQSEAENTRWSVTELSELEQLVGERLTLILIWGYCGTMMKRCKSMSEGVRGGSHLARHHCSGEQFVQLNQLVGCGVKLERNAVQCVSRFHLDHKTRERTHLLKLYREDTKMWQMLRDRGKKRDE